MHKKLATLVHINPQEGITPLVGGYLKSYAYTEEDIKTSWDIQLYSTTINNSASQVIRDIVLLQPDVVGFSLYVWNIGLIQRILPTLRGLLSKTTQFLLGGVQVMNAAEEYVDPSWENVAVCNGEGEITFLQYLRQVGDIIPNMHEVGGITFVREGEYITTSAHKRIKNLGEIPSPYLADIFDPKDLGIALIETNRGCPYKCEYCFWGGAIGQKVHQLSEDRLRDEIDYLASKRTRTLHVCDANFGIFPKDVALAQYMVDVKKRTGYPVRVNYSSAKNNPERAVEIAKIFTTQGVLSTQPISLQTMNSDALDLARRSNIKLDTYLEVQKTMNDEKVASFIELIWPLPGETLDSFKAGIQELCEMQAQAFGVYPMVWLKNVGFEQKKEDLGVVTLREADTVSGAEVVIQTKEVGHKDWIAGMVFANSVMLLYDCRGLYHTGRIVNALEIESYRDMFDRFVAWMQTAANNGITDLWREGETSFESMYKFTWRGAIVEAAMHRCRTEFNNMLLNFAAESVIWTESRFAELIRAAVEFDILARPYAYANTPTDYAVELEAVSVSDSSDRSYHVSLPFDIPRIVQHIEKTGSLEGKVGTASTTILSIDHRKRQFLRMPNKHDTDHHQFCHKFVTEIGNYLPEIHREKAKTPSFA